MGNRVRYLSTSAITRKELSAVGEALGRNEYSDQLAWGFVDVRIQGDSVVATFVERFETEEQVTHPFGEITTYKRVQFSRIRFRLALQLPQLEVYDSPRAITPLLTELSKCCEFRLVFSNVSIDLEQFTKTLKREASNITLVSATLRDISLAADVFARVSVVGSGEIGPYLKLASLGKKGLLEKACLCGTIASNGFKVEITSDARIQILAGHDDDLMKILRCVVIKSLVQKP